MSLFDSGVRPAIDEYLKKKGEELREYGEYWSASSAGYCQRLQIMRRLGVPKVPELEEDQARTTRVFESGHIFHEWVQRITKEAGLSIAQELELQDEELMIRGHIDDLILIPASELLQDKDKLLLYDYKTAHSASFNYKKNQPMGFYHTMQLATYMYMLRKRGTTHYGDAKAIKTADLTEARILSISKDDLRMHETQVMWSDELEKQVLDYWTSLNRYWSEKKMPPCTCLEHDGGFMGKRSAKGKIYGDYFWEDEPCSLKWYKLWKEKKDDIQKAEPIN